MVVVVVVKSVEGSVDRKCGIESTYKHFIRTHCCLEKGAHTRTHSHIVGINCMK